MEHPDVLDLFLPILLVLYYKEIYLTSYLILKHREITVLNSVNSPVLNAFVLRPHYLSKPCGLL